MPTIEELMELINSLTAKVDALTPKEDVEDVPDPRDESLEKGVSYFVKKLDGVLPKEKLDTLSFNELLLVAEMKGIVKKDSHDNPAPPLDSITKKDVKLDDHLGVEVN